MFYALIQGSTCLGFSVDLESAVRLQKVFGEGCTIEAVYGKYPSDEYAAAKALGASRAKRGFVVVDADHEHLPRAQRGSESGLYAKVYS